MTAVLVVYSKIFLTRGCEAAQSIDKRECNSVSASCTKCVLQLADILD